MAGIDMREVAAKIVYKLATGEQIRRDYLNKAAKRAGVQPNTLLARVRAVAREYGVDIGPLLLKQGAKPRLKMGEVPRLEGKMRLGMRGPKGMDRRIKTGKFAKELPGLLQRAEHREAVKREHESAGLRFLSGMYLKDWVGGSRHILDPTLQKYKRKQRGK